MCISNPCLGASDLLLLFFSILNHDQLVNRTPVIPAPFSPALSSSVPGFVRLMATSLCKYQWQEWPGGIDASLVLPATTGPLGLDIMELQQAVPYERQQDVRSAVQAALEVQPYAVNHKVHPSGIAVLSDLSDDTFATLLNGGPPYTFQVALLTIPTAQSYLQLFFSSRGAQATLGYSALKTKDPATAEALCGIIDLDVRSTQDNDSGGWKIEAPTEHDAAQERRVVGAVIQKVIRAIAKRVGAPDKLSLTGTATAETANVIYRVEAEYTKELGQTGSYTKLSIARDTRQPKTRTSDDVRHNEKTDA